MRLALGLALTIGMLTAVPLPSMGQALDHKELIELLKPGAKPMTTRSMGTTRGVTVDARPTTLNTDQVEFVRSLGTDRGITVEERHELAEIVEEVALPEVEFTVEFEFGSDELTHEAKEYLLALGDALTSKELEDSVFLLSGHTDDVGSDEANLDLSERRARSVKAFLVSELYVRPSMLRPVGFGEEQLKNKDYPDAPENRRVTVTNLVY